MPPTCKAFLMGDSGWGVTPLEDGTRLHGGHPREADSDSGSSHDSLTADSFALDSFRKGMVIGILLDCDEGVLTYFVDGESKGVAFSTLRGQGPFTPFITAGSGGWVFKLNLTPGTLPAGVNGISTAIPEAEPEASSAVDEETTPGGGLGGLGVCAERPQLSWLLTIGWIVGACTADAQTLKDLPSDMPSAMPLAEFVGTLLPELLAGEQADPLSKVLAGVLLEGLPAPADAAAARQVLESMVADAPGWVRSAKAAVLRQWCAPGPTATANPVWDALAQALGDGGGLARAALEVVAETAALRCLAPARVEGGGTSGTGTVVEVCPPQVAVLPAGSAAVVWHDAAHLWAEPRRCQPPFPQGIVGAITSLIRANLRGNAAASNVTVQELFALLAVVEDPSVAQASIGLLRDLLHLVLAETPDPALGGAWSLVPPNRRINLCTALLARPQTSEVLAEGIRRSGKSAKEVFEDSMAPCALIPVPGASDGKAGAQEAGPMELWQPPQSGKEGYLSQAHFTQLLQNVVKGLSRVEVDELWELVFTGKELQVVDKCGGRWHASIPGAEEESWTELPREVGDALDLALLDRAATHGFSAQLPPSEESQEFKVDFATMTLQLADGSAARRITRQGPREPAIDLAEFEALASQAAPGKAQTPGSRPSSATIEKEASSENILLANSTVAFASVLEAVGLGEAKPPRTREALLRLLAAAPPEKTGAFRILLPPQKKEKQKSTSEAAPEGERDEAAQAALDGLRRRGTTPVSAVETIAKWTESHLAQLICAKIASCCKALEPQALGPAAEVVQMLLTIRPLADLPRLQEHLGPALAQDRGLAAAFQQAATAEFLGVLRNCLRPVEPVLVQESDHPYSNNMDDWKEVRIPGAKNLCVRFDPQCVTESGCDYLTFYTEKNGTILPATGGNRMSGRGDVFADFTTPGESFWWNFKTDGSNTDWGFKFTVTAQPPIMQRFDYWDAESSAPNMEDALWLLKVALAGDRSDDAGAVLPDLRTDILAPVLFALVRKLPAEDGRIQALGALGDVLDAARGEPSQLWSELHCSLHGCVARKAAWATSFGQAAAALLVRLAPSLPQEPAGLRFGPPAPQGGALVDPARARVLFLRANVVSALEGAVVRVGEAAAVQVSLSKGARVGVAPAADGPMDLSQLVFAEIESAASVKNQWSEDSYAVGNRAATLSGEENDVVVSRRMEGTNYMVRARSAYGSGVHYWEIKCLKRDGGGNGYHIIGIATEESKERFVGFDCGDQIWGWWLDDDYKVHNGQKVSMGGRIPHETGSVYGVLLDCDAGELSFFSNGKNVGGVAYSNLQGRGPFYPVLCVGCLESNSYKVDFSPEEVPIEARDKVLGGGGDRKASIVTCDLRFGLGAGQLRVVEPNSGVEPKVLPLPAGVQAWRFAVVGVPGAKAGLERLAEPPWDVALAKAQAAMEALAKGSDSGPLPEFSTDAFVAWHETRGLADEEANAGEKPEAEVERPPWASLGPEQLLVLGAGCTEVNGVYDKIAAEPETYMSAQEATLVNDRDGHWVICTGFNVELWAYEAAAKEGPWSAGPRGQLPAPTVCGSAGPPAAAPEAAPREGRSATPSPSIERLQCGLPALLRGMRGVTTAVPPGASGARVEVPGAERLALALEAGRAVEVTSVGPGEEERRAELWSGEVAEVDGESCTLQVLAMNAPLGWSGEPQSNAPGQGLFEAAAERSHSFSPRGLLTLGPMQLFREKMFGSAWDTRKLEVPASAVRCRSGHVMKSRPKDSGWHCDKCGGKGSDILRFRCDENCNWDFCGKCQQELTSGLQLDQVKSSAVPPMAVGSKVQAEFVYKIDSRGMPEKRPAVIAEVRPGGSYLVTWEDGDSRDRVKLGSQVWQEGSVDKKELVVVGIAADSPVARWNAEHPDLAISRGCRIPAAQDEAGDAEAVLKAMCGVTEDDTPLRVTYCRSSPSEQHVGPSPALSWPGVFQQWTHQDAGTTFATSPEIRVRSISGELQVGICIQGQSVSLLSAGVLRPDSIASGDTLRLLVAMNSNGNVLAIRVLQNGREVSTWEEEVSAVADGSKVAQVTAPEVSQLKVWALCTTSVDGPRRQGCATLQLMSFSTAGPRAKLPSDAAPLGALGGIPADAWGSFASWWPEAECARVAAWPVGRRDEVRLLADLSQEVDAFRSSVMGGWEIEGDEELVRSIESMAKDAGKKLLSGARFEFTPKNSKQWAVAGHSASEGYGRYLVLCTLNTLISKHVLPVVDLGKLLATPHGRALHSLKRLLFSEIRGTAVRANGAMGNQVKLELKRSLATTCREAGQCDTDGTQMLFSQASEKATDPGAFRRSGQNWQDQPFSVNYEDEAGVDQGGLYRDFLDGVTEELMSRNLPVLVPSANQSTNTGEHRDTWVLNPALEAGSGSPGERLLLFLGRLMGLCLLRGDILPLNLPVSFWKSLQGEDVDLEDLEAIDVAAANSVRMLREPVLLGVDADSFHDTFPDLRYVVEDSASQARELVEGGADRPVMFEDAPRYAERMLEVRLHESDQQLEVLRRGLREVALMSSWALWPWQTLEERVVGVSHIDVALLRKKTIYEGYEQGDPAVGRFWAALESFSQDELRSFLHFTWGRSRLPPEASDKWGPGFKISRAGRSDMLPLAHTCFFQLELPAYDTQEVMKDKLLFAVQNCISMAIA
uniref:HECT-type E3 ubiquitin transferase n=1 Tax=Alexandrium monilatum TaxID=311494 RepID=A0A7S4SXW0_9DINO